MHRGPIKDKQISVSPEPVTWSSGRNTVVMDQKWRIVELVQSHGDHCIYRSNDNLKNTASSSIRQEKDRNPISAM